MSAPAEDLDDAPPLGRPAAVGAVVGGVALLAVVVLATRSAGGDVGSGRSIVIGQGLSGFLVGTFAMVFVAGVVLWFFRLRNGGGPAPEEEAGSRWPWWLRSLLGCGLLAGLVLIGSWFAGPSHPEEQARTPIGAAGASARLPGSVGAHDATGSGFYVGLGVAVLGAAALAWAAIRRQGAEPSDDDDDDGGELEPFELADRAPLVAALAMSLEDLEREADPRRAVIAAYVRMQSVLATAGVARRASDTEPELVRRALDRFGVEAEPARRLTEIFEQARYSPHVVEEATRAEAIAAVGRLRAGLLVEQ